MSLNTHSRSASMTPPPALMEKAMEPAVMKVVQTGDLERAVRMLICHRVAEVLEQHGGTLRTSELLAVMKDDFPLSDGSQYTSEEVFDFLSSASDRFELVAPPPGIGAPTDAGIRVKARSSRRTRARKAASRDRHSKSSTWPPSDFVPPCEPLDMVPPCDAPEPQAFFTPLSLSMCPSPETLSCCSTASNTPRGR
mmetsp:Transcript_28716/g.63306  ORF Transcript_28716/g.63306 Transcript_28716/m.63306 type:complete len:195 (+) Transcript_28716:195-779(+)